MKYIALVFVMLLIIPMASATIETLGTFKKGSRINLIQTCSNCTFNNITLTIYIPNSTVILNGQFAMTRNGTLYNYTLNANQSLMVGRHVVTGFGNPNNVTTIWNYDYYVTQNGDDLTTGTSLLYIFILVLSSGMFIFCLYGAIKIPYANERTYDGTLIKVNFKRHIKIFLIVMCYLIVMWINYIAWNITLAYSPLLGASLFFRFVFRAMVSFAKPISIVYIIFFIISFISDLKLADKVTKENLFRDEA